MILFEDYECPACSHFETTSLPKVESKYVSAGSVLLAVWHRPLPQHTRAVGAAAAADCAGREGKFWEMRNTLFRNQQRLSDADLAKFAHEFGLREFGVCTQDDATARRITDWQTAAKEFKVNSTPTVFLGTIVGGDRLKVSSRWSGSRSFDDVARAIESLLSSAPIAK
jgi:protein-disulfide isomerase